MRRAYVFRLYPNVNQERELGTTLETHRRLYNTCLDYRKLAHEMYRTSITYGDCSRWFKGQRAKNPYYAKLNFSSAQATMRRLDKAFQAFFRRVKAKEKPGYPRFQGRDHFDSIEFPAYGDGIKRIGSKLYVQNVGTIRINLQRCSRCGATVPKTLSDRWHECPDCGLSVHRDENSAKEILRLGLLAWTGPVGGNVGQ
jgi:putative transposase